MWKAAIDILRLHVSYLVWLFVESVFVFIYFSCLIQSFTSIRFQPVTKHTLQMSLKYIYIHIESIRNLIETKYDPKL